MIRLSTFLLALALHVPSACSPLDRDPGLTRDGAIFEDRGPAAKAERVRALVSLRPREPAALRDLALDVSTPASPRFRAYVSRGELASRFAPPDADVDALKRFASVHALTVRAIAENKLLAEISGSVSAFNAALATTLHAYDYTARDQRVYGTPGGLELPSFITSLVTLDAEIPAERVARSPSSRPEIKRAPVHLGYLPAHVASAYHFDVLAKDKARGEGATLAVVVGGDADPDDLRDFWRAFDIERPLPRVVEVGGAGVGDGGGDGASVRTIEATMDIEWAGALAPKANLLVVAGPDLTTTSLLFAFNEAIGRGEADVVTYSYSRHETSEPAAVREAFDRAALYGAAMGVTVVAASGDTAKPDVPATCPFVTAVAGTTLTLEADGSLSEEAWPRSGSGFSSFAKPTWQGSVDTGGGAAAARRAVADVALNAGSSYVALFQGRWDSVGGTSLAAPVFAAMIAVIDGARARREEPPVGFLNPALYGNERVQRSFRDVVAGGTRENLAAPGWDFPTGWGAPLADRLADTL